MGINFNNKKDGQRLKHHHQNTFYQELYEPLMQVDVDICHISDF